MVLVAGPVAVWTVPPVLFGLLRYGWRVQRRGAGGDPSRELLRDRPLAGAVLGKILLLVFIILFIQKRPQGLFALKGRAVE